MKKQSEYKGLPQQNITKKIVSSFFDGIILLILNIVIVLTIVFPILRNNEDFKYHNDTCFDEIYQLYQIHEEAKINKLVEGSKKEVIAKKDLFYIYLDKQINLSYLNNEELFNQENIYLEVNDNYSTFDNDELAYYFVKYKIERNINIESYNQKEPSDYFFNELLFKNINSNYFNLEKEFPVIKFEQALSLYNYRHELSDDSVLFDDFYDAFLTINQIALEDITYYDVYQEHYQKYLVAFNNMANYENVALIIVYIITFIIYFVIPQIIFGDGITLGRLITKGRIVSKDENKVNVKQLIISNLVLFIAYTVIIIFTSLFSFGLTNLSSTLFTLGSLSLSYLQLLMIGVGMVFINFGFICFNVSHTSFTEIISKTQTKDIRYYVR